MIFLFISKVHMDPHNDVKSDVDYQAVLSHMNIHKGKKNQFIILIIFKYFFFHQIKFFIIMKHHPIFLILLFMVERSMKTIKMERR